MGGEGERERDGEEGRQVRAQEKKKDNSNEGVGELGGQGKKERNDEERSLFEETKSQ